MELFTSRNGTNGVTTSTPGPSAGVAQPSLSNQGYSNALAQILRWKASRETPDGQSGYPSVASPESMRPTMGQARIGGERYPTRQVIDPYDNPYSGMSFAGGAMGGQHYPKMVQERMINGRWEFDDIDPRRSGGGGPGRISFEPQNATLPAGQNPSFTDFARRSMGPATYASHYGTPEEKATYFGGAK